MKRKERIDHEKTKRVFGNPVQFRWKGGGGIGGERSLVSVHRGQKYPEPAAGCRDDDAVILGGEGKRGGRRGCSTGAYDKLISAAEEREKKRV